jgi:hypothetical protein
VALVYRWGSDRSLHTAVPWLISPGTLSPKVQYVTALPWVVKTHMLGGIPRYAIYVALIAWMATFAGLLRRLARIMTVRVLATTAS